MKHSTTCIAALVVAMSAPALAQSPVLPIQGTLREMAGNLVNDTRSVTFGLYNEETGGTAFYTVQKQVSFTNGQFVAYLGDEGDDPLQPESFDGLPEVYLGITISPETVEMTPRVRLGSAPFSIYAQLCGDAQSAQQAQTATTASTANDLACSGCVDGGDINSTAFAVTTYSVANLTDDNPPQKLPQRCIGPFDAIYCALSHVSRSSMIQPDSGVSRYCDVTQVSGGWQLCSGGGRPGEVPKTVLGCEMTCFTLQ